MSTCRAQARSRIEWIFVGKNIKKLLSSHPKSFNAEEISNPEDIPCFRGEGEVTRAVRMLQKSTSSPLKAGSYVV